MCICVIVCVKSLLLLFVALRPGCSGHVVLFVMWLHYFDSVQDCSISSALAKQIL